MAYKSNERVDMGFELFRKFIPENGALQLTLRMAGDGRARIMVGFLDEDRLKEVAPLTVEGSFAELDTGFFGAIEQYHAAATGFRSNLDLICAEMKRVEEAKKKEAEEKKKKPSTVKTVDRPAPEPAKPLDLGVVDPDAVGTLVYSGATEPAFKEVLEKASPASIIEASKKLSTMATRKTVFAVVDAAMKRRFKKGLLDFGVSFAATAPQMNLFGGGAAPGEQQTLAATGTEG